MKCFARLVLGFGFLFINSIASAAVLPGTYQLFDHPDGVLTNSLGSYGLRMDTLELNTSGPVFSVNENGAEVFLTWDGGTTATIEGDIYRHDTGDLWHVIHVIENVFAVPDGFATADETISSMTLTDTNNGGTQYVFNNKSDGVKSFAFLADSHRCDGHTDCGPIVARGWFQNANGNQYGTNDWLVSAQLTVIPVPAAVWLFSSGLIGLVGVARRRQD